VLDHERTERAVEACVAQPGQPVQVLLRKRMPDRGLRHTLWEFMGIQDSSGAVTEIQCVGFDITKQLELEEALQQSETRYRSAVEASMDAFYLLESVRDEATGDIIDFRIVEANEHAIQQLGLSRSVLINGLICELFPINRTGGYFEQYKRVVETGQPFEQDYMIPAGHTAPGWYHHQVVKVGDGVAIVNRDISERIAMEQDLRIKESAIASSITPIALADLNGRLTYINQAFLDLWKLEDAQAVLGRSVLDFWVSEAAAQAVVSAIEENNHFVGELTARLNDGSRADVELTASLVTEADGTPICMMASFRDVTERKQAEAIALENERLKTQFHKEQDQNELMQRMISMLSHDLRTPLAIIASSRDLLDRYYDRLSEEKRREKLEAIGRQIQFALEILQDTVNMARGNLSNRDFRPAPTNLAMLCQVSVQELQVARHDNRSIHFSNPGDVGTVSIDEVLVSRILLNLLSNALKYSPEGGEIHLELDQRDEWIVLRVIDEGSGINDIDLPHLFEPFYRAKEVDHIEGTGLGLSIVNDCVERHRGRIRVESIPGRGSTFTVELPTVQIDEAFSPK
jgi:PAS domain S-box-containing protein